MTNNKVKPYKQTVKKEYIEDLNTLPRTSGKMQTVFKVLEIGSTVVGLANFKASIIVFTIGFIGKKIFEKRDLETEYMPDEWLERVAETPDVSDKGLVFLVSELKKFGKISVAAAQKFIDIESEIVSLKEKAIEKDENLNKVGAKKLLDKTKNTARSGFSSENLETISTVLKNIKMVKDTIPAPVLQFGFELLKNIRKK